MLNHRIPILEGFLNTADEEGYVQAQIQGLTNTLRFQHSHPCVNLPKPDRPFADGIRGALIAPDGYELCGADLSSLEDKIKQNYIYKYDPKYVESMDLPDYDAHLNLALLAGMMNEQEVSAYKEGDKSKKRIRDTAKNGTYALQYGAYPPRLVITCGVTPQKAKEMFEAYWKLNWSIKAVAKEQKVKTLDDGTMWLQNPTNWFWYSLRKDNDRFSTLVQGTASYVFDMWVREVLRDRPQITAQFHDEFILTVKKGYREKVTNHILSALDTVNKQLNHPKPYGCGIQYGERYSLIH